MIPNDFDQEARRQTIFAWAEIPIAIGSKPRGYPVGLARGDRVENGGGHDCAEDLGAEFFGTFWLTFAGSGSAVLAAGLPALGIGFLGVSFALGLTVLTMAYAVGHISGEHFNCAVTVGLWAGGRFKTSDVIPYMTFGCLRG